MALRCGITGRDRFSAPEAHLRRDLTMTLVLEVPSVLIDAVRLLGPLLHAGVKCIACDAENTSLLHPGVVHEHLTRVRDLILLEGDILPTADSVLALLPQTDLYGVLELLSPSCRL